MNSGRVENAPQPDGRDGIRPRDVDPPAIQREQDDDGDTTGEEPVHVKGMREEDRQGQHRQHVVDDGGRTTKTRSSIGMRSPSSAMMPSVKAMSVAVGTAQPAAVGLEFISRR